MGHLQGTMEKRSGWGLPGGDGEDIKDCCPAGGGGGSPDSSLLPLVTLGTQVRHTMNLGTGLPESYDLG